MTKAEDLLFKRIDDVCSEERRKEQGERVMVNVFKLNKKSEGMDKYGRVAVGQLAKIGSSVHSRGDANSEYWDAVRWKLAVAHDTYHDSLQVMLMNFRSTAAMCSLVTSREYNSVIMAKREGLLDSYSYFTQQIL